jgi:putative transposase
MSKTHFSAIELEGLPGLPGTRRGVAKKADAEKWPKRARSGKGGGWEYPLGSLPAVTRNFLIAQQLTNIPPVVTSTASAGAPTPSARATGSLPVAAPRASASTPPSSLVVAAERAPTQAVATQKAPPLAVLRAADRFLLAAKPEHLTDAQRQCASARMALLDEAYRLRAGGVTLEMAFTILSQNGARGILRPELQALIPMANARNSEGRVLSPRAMLNWHTFLKPVPADDLNGKLAALAPHVPQRAFELPPEIVAVIAKLDTSGNSVAYAARKFAEEHGFGDNHIEVNRLYHRVQRALKDKVPKSIVDKLRHTGAGLLAKKPYITRSTKDLLPNDIWVVDGHSMKAKWAHPETGKPFVPEVTVVEDWYSRRVVGWSVSLSENALAVGEAMLKGIAAEGVPGIVYSDGGAGENAKYIKAVYANFGIHHEIGRPGNPQGRGVIERAWASHAIEVARENPLFRGSGVDRDTLRRNSIAVDKSVKAVKRGDVNVIPFAQLPPLSAMIAALAKKFAEYNSRPHRGLPRHPAEPRHYTPNEWAAVGMEDPNVAIERIDPEAHRLMYFPHRIMQAKRGRVAPFKGVYYGHPDLYKLVDGQSVKVHFDITDPRSVWVADLDGRLICEAELDANTRPAMPPSIVEASRLRRLDQQTKRVKQKLDDLDEERLGVAQYIAQNHAAPQFPDVPEVDESANVVPIGALPAPVAAVDSDAAPARPIFRDPEDRYRWLMTHRNAWANADAAFVERFVESASYRDLEEIFAREGIAWDASPSADEGGDKDVFRGAAA